MTAPETQSPLDLDRLEALAEKAAKLHRGPWRVDDNGTDVLGAMRDIDDVILAEFGGKPFHTATPEFAALFAALDPTTARALVSRVREAEKQVAAMIRVSESLAEVIRTHAPEAHKRSRPSGREAGSERRHGRDLQDARDPPGGRPD